MELGKKEQQSIINWIDGRQIRGGGCLYAGTRLLTSPDESVLYSYGRHWVLAKKMGDNTILINSDVVRGWRRSNTPLQQAFINRLVMDRGIPHLNVSASAIQKFINFRALDASMIEDISPDKVQTFIYRYNDGDRTSEYYPERWLDSFSVAEVEQKRASSTPLPRPLGEIINRRHLMEKTYKKPGKEKYTVYYYEDIFHTAGECVLKVPLTDTGENTKFRLAYTGYLLCGIDEGHAFCAQLPIRGADTGGANFTIEQAKDELKPWVVKQAEANHRPVLRQGEWFFVRRWESIDDAVKSMLISTPLKKSVWDYSDAYSDAYSDTIARTITAALVGEGYIRTACLLVDSLTKVIARLRARDTKAERAVAPIRNVIIKHLKKMALPRKNNQGNTHTCKGTPIGNDILLCTGTVKHSAREHAPLELGEGLWTAHKNTEIDSATSTYDVD